MNRVILKPKPGILVRDPKTRLHLKAAGENKVLTTFWRRRINDGDVEIIKNSTEKKKEIVTNEKGVK